MIVILSRRTCASSHGKPSSQPSPFFFQNFEVAKEIYETGCIQAGEEWMERNLLAIASGAVGTAFTQVRVGERRISVSVRKAPAFNTHRKTLGEHRRNLPERLTL